MIWSNGPSAKWADETRRPNLKPAQSHAEPTSSNPTRDRRVQFGQNRIWSEADQTGPKLTRYRIWFGSSSTGQPMIEVMAIIGDDDHLHRSEVHLMPRSNKDLILSCPNNNIYAGYK